MNVLHCTCTRTQVANNNRRHNIYCVEPWPHCTCNVAYLSSKVPGVECDASKLLGSLLLLFEVLWLQVLAVLPYAKVHPHS